jgi:hypothetical protein
MNSETKPTQRQQTANRAGYGLIMLTCALIIARFVMDLVAPTAETKLAMASLNGGVDVKAVDGARRIQEFLSWASAAAAVVAALYWVVLQAKKHWDGKAGNE